MFGSAMRRWLALVLALVMLASACGGDDGDETEAGGGDDEETTETTSGGISTTVGDSEAAEEDEPEEEPEAAAGPVGTLRMVEFSPVTTFDPAGAQTAQSAYLYPVYDTLTRQNEDFTLSPALATDWLPAWVVRVCEVVHFYEAILAVSAIFIWHFYFVILRPAIYPMSWIWLDGRMPAHEWKTEHPEAEPELTMPAEE
jgi:ABC-type transport system substrate-binding protein